MKVDPLIVEAIIEGARAGVYWRAARLNPKTARTWEGFGELHHETAANLLAQAAENECGR